MHRFALVGKHSEKSRFWPNLMRKKNFPDVTLGELIDKYHGFEGETVEFFSFSEDLDSLKKKLSTESSQLIFINSDGKDIPSLVANEFSWLGYDFGICEEDMTVYSSIFNEILFGNIERLVSFGEDLNECLLFSDIAILEKYISLHHQLFMESKDVEDDEDMKIYELWSYVLQ